MARILIRSASLVGVVLFVGCGRSDPFAFDRFDEDGGESGSGAGRGGRGGSDPGGRGGVSGTSGVTTGGFPGKGGCPGSLGSCNGTCVDLRNDRSHCGSCFSSCPPDAECFDGACYPVCPGGTLCFGNCTDLSSDPYNCGGCGYYCGDGFVCNYGYCESVCGIDRIACGASCVDPFNDPRNCGGCGYQCGIGQACVGGGCRDVPNSIFYTVSASPLPFVDACLQAGNSSVLRSIDDDLYGAIRIPWFNFFGVPTDAAWVSTNGVLGFGSPSVSYDNNCSFGQIERSIFAFWDDLLTGPAGVCLAELGTAPNRMYVATWNQTAILQLSDATSLTFSIVLTESTQTIDVLYATMTGGGQLSAGTSATIGIASSAQFSVDCCNQACVRSNTGRRYTPTER